MMLGGLSAVNLLYHLSSHVQHDPPCLPCSQSESSNEKENLLNGRGLPCQPPARLTCEDSGYEPSACTATVSNSHQADLLTNASGDLERRSSPAIQREEGEGWDREHAKRLEERNKWFEKGVPLNEMGSRWDSMELKSGSVPVPVIDTMDSDVSMKWTELENLSFRDMSAQSLIGAQTYRSSTLQEPLSCVHSQMSLSIPEVQISETDISKSQGVLFSKHGTRAFQTNTAETSEKEVRENLQSVPLKKKVFSTDSLSL